RRAITTPAIHEALGAVREWMRAVREQCASNCDGGMYYSYVAVARLSHFHPVDGHVARQFLNCPGPYTKICHHGKAPVHGIDPPDSRAHSRPRRPYGPESKERRH